MVAEWQGGHPEAAGPSGTVAAGGGQPGGSSGAGVAAAECAELKKNLHGVLRSSPCSATLRGMTNEFRYRSQIITTTQVEFIRQLIAQHPEATRRRLSLLLCEAWEWKQANGAPRDMVCRGLLLGLHRAGHIELPPARLTGFNPAARYSPERWKAVAVELDTTPLAVPLSALRPLEFRQVRRTLEEPSLTASCTSITRLAACSPSAST